jgi:hypothetical protein
MLERNPTLGDPEDWAGRIASKPMKPEGPLEFRESRGDPRSGSVYNNRVILNEIDAAGRAPNQSL